MKSRKKSFYNGLSFIALLVIASCTADENNIVATPSVDTTITNENLSGVAEGDTSNISYDEDDLVENATFENTIQIVFSDKSSTITNPVPDDVVITQDGAGITYKILYLKGSL